MLGRIAAALGLLALLSSPYTLWITEGSLRWAGGKALLGAAALAYAFSVRTGFTHQARPGRPRARLVREAALLLGFLVGLLGINLIASRSSLSWDLTQRRIYSLAPQTLALLRDLPAPVHALSFIPPTHPTYEAVVQLLTRYHEASSGKFELATRDARRDPELAARYQLREGQSAIILSRGQGTTEVHTSISLPAGQELTEQLLTNALSRLTTVEARKVYVLAGHGEWPLEASGEDGLSLADFSRSLFQEGYAPESLNLAGKAGVPQDAALVIVAGARTPPSPREELLLRSYLDQGGHVLFFAEAQADGGLRALLAAYGVEVDPGMVADEESNAGSPYVIVTNVYSEHQLARTFKRLQLNLQLPTVRGLSVLHEGLAEGVRVEPVVLSSPTAWEQVSLTSQPIRETGAKSGSIPLVVASSRRVPGPDGQGTSEARLVVFGDSELLLDTNWRRESYRNLVLNAAAWATRQLDKITLRPVDRDLSSVDLDASTMARVRFVSLDLLPCMLLGLGLTLWIRRQSQ